MRRGDGGHATRAQNEPRTLGRRNRILRFCMHLGRRAQHHRLFAAQAAAQHAWKALPGFAERAALRDGVELFNDASHFSVTGHQLAAELLRRPVAETLGRFAAAQEPGRL